jgi:uncharacterized protein (DUF433 family)
VNNWQDFGHNRPGVIASRDEGAALSYLQLIELGVVAAMRKAGVSLNKIRQAREYLAKQLGSQFPFAQYKFKTDGKKLFMDYGQVMGPRDRDKLLSLNEHGQLAWNEIIGRRLREFEYDDDLGTVLRWRVAGENSPIWIDPRIAFGAPQVSGVPTRVLRERWNSGESVDDIADDYELEGRDVAAALRFENVEVDPARPSIWVH